MPIAFSVTFKRFESTISSDQNDRNDKIGIVFTATGSLGAEITCSIPQGASPAETFTGLYANASNEIKIDYTRQNIYRTCNFSCGISIDSVSVDTIRYFADASYFETPNYAFDIPALELQLTPNYGIIVDPDVEVTLQFKLNNSVTGSLEKAYQLSTLFEDISLNSKTLSVKDEYGGLITADIIFVPTNTLSVITDLNPLSITNDPMVVVLDSDLKTASATRYKFLMYDSDDNLLLTTLQYPDIENSYYGIYNMNILYNDYTITEMYFSESTLTVTDNVYEFYYEATDDPDQETTQSVNKFAIKGATTYGSTFDIDDYIGELNSNYKFLTSWTGDYLFRENDYNMRNIAYGNFTTVVPTEVFNAIAIVRYKYGDTRGSFDYLDTDQVNYITTIDPSENNNKIYSIPFGPVNLNDAYEDNAVHDANYNIISNNFLLDSDTEYYEIHLVEIATSIERKTESLYAKINKDEDCTKFEPTKFIWRDKLGCYNTFTFNGRNVKTFNFDRNVINNDYHSLIANEWTYVIGDRGRSNVNVKQLESHIVTSGWLNDNLSVNIGELYASNDVYVIIGEETYPIILTSKKIEEKTIKNNRLFNHSINYQMAYDININE